MNDTLLTITTTPVPMPGYDEAVVGSEGVISRFRSISEAFHAEQLPDLWCAVARQTTADVSRRLYSVTRPQASAIDWATLPLCAQPGRPVTTVAGLESARFASEDTVRHSFLSLFVAALKAKATGDWTCPVILYCAGHGGRRTDLWTGRWVIQSQYRLQHVFGELWMELPAQEAGSVLSHEATDLLSTFQRLAAAWKKQKKHLSSMTAIESSPHYRGIIALGETAVPLLLKELERDPDYWFAALHAITGENPVPAQDRGNLIRMTEHWLNWGRRTRRAE